MIFNPCTTCISGRKTRVWRAIQVTGPDGLETQGNTEVALKDVWLDKDSQTEKQNQESIYAKLEKIKQEDLKWLDDDYQGQVKEVLSPIILFCLPQGLWYHRARIKEQCTQMLYSCVDGYNVFT